MHNETSAHNAFRSVSQALQFYNNNSPVRFKPVNLLEVDFVRRTITDDFAFEHPARKWAAVAYSLHAALSIFNARDRDIFRACCTGDSAHMLHPREAARAFGISVRRCYQILDEIRFDFERELIRRGLLVYESGNASDR